MTPMLKIVSRVIGRRIDAGQSFDEIVLDYPKLTEEEIKTIKNGVIQ